MKPTYLKDPFEQPYNVFEKTFDLTVAPVFSSLFQYTCFYTKIILKLH